MRLDGVVHGNMETSDDFQARFTWVNETLLVPGGARFSQRKECL